LRVLLVNGALAGKSGRSAGKAADGPEAPELNVMSRKCDHWSMAPWDQSDAMDVVLMADPLVAGTPVADNGEGLVDLRARRGGQAR
jgi:hypothetical protein